MGNDRQWGMTDNVDGVKYNGNDKQWTMTDNEE